MELFVCNSRGFLSSLSAELVSFVSVVFFLSSFNRYFKCLIGSVVSVYHKKKKYQFKFWQRAKMGLRCRKMRYLFPRNFYGINSSLFSSSLSLPYEHWTYQMYPLCGLICCFCINCSRFGCFIFALASPVIQFVKWFSWHLCRYTVFYLQILCQPMKFSQLWKWGRKCQVNSYFEWHHILNSMNLM